MGIADLIEAMRTSGYFSFDDLKYAIFESNGKLSALENPERDMKPSLPMLMINDGKPIYGNFEKNNITLDELIKLLDGEIKKPSDAEVLTMDTNGKIYLQKKHEKYKILHVRLNND